MTDIVVISAYRQLDHIERRFVDAYVMRLADYADKVNERITNALYRPISSQEVMRSGGMFDRPLVMAAITERVNQIAIDKDLTAEMIIRKLKNILTTNLGDFMHYDKNGHLTMSIDKATPEQLAAIQSYETIPRKFGGESVKIKLYDNLQAIKLAMQYMNLLEPDNDHFRASTARPITAVAKDETTDKAANRYAAMIDG